MMGLLIRAAGALAQQAPTQPPPSPTPPDQPDATKPADPNAPPTATMTPITVTGTRPSDDFAPPAPSLNRMGASAVRDVPQSVTIINKALMQSQGGTSLTSAVRTGPGLTIGAAEGGQIGNNININGFSART